jgi:hypothetical protein
LPLVSRTGDSERLVPVPARARGSPAHRRWQQAVNELGIFVAGYTSVFALGFQSRNVNHGNYRLAALSAFFIAVAQASIWQRITAADATSLDTIIYGLSGSLAIVSSMAVHERFVKGRKPDGRA